MLVDECGGANVGWGAPHGIRAGWSTPGGGCRNSTMSFTGSVPSLHPAGSIRSLRSQHSQVPETPRRCMYCHPMQIGTPSHYVPHTPVHYYTPSHCVAPGQNGTYTPHRGSSYHGDPRVRCLDVDENLGDNTNWVLGDLRTLHRCVPALRRTGIDVAGIQTHFYPEGGWGWLVCAAGFLALLLTTGMQLAFGLLHLQAVRHLGDIHLMDIENDTPVMNEIIQYETDWPTLIHSECSFVEDNKFGDQTERFTTILGNFTIGIMNDPELRFIILPIDDIRRVIIFVPTDGTTVEQIYDEIGSIVKTLTSLEASAKTSLRKKTMVSLPPITIKFSSMLIVFTKGNTISVKTAFVDTSWIGALSAAVSRGSAPLVVGASRRGSTRLTAVIGGFVLALASLFTSFALQMHQVLLSYGLVLGAGAGLVRESAELVLGHYFKKRREFVEMVMQAGTGVGIALFSVFYKEALTKLGWRLGLQSITGALSLTFFLGLIYRSAALYHPQRSAIVHLKNQRPKVKEKRTNADSPRRPLVDLSPLHNRPVRMLMLAAAAAGFGLYSPAFYIALQGHKDGLEPSALVLLQTCLGLAAALGCAAWGIVTARPSTQCFVSRQYLCQAALLGVAVAQIALGSVEGYHGLVLASGLYGASLGGALYSLKMLAFERLRRRNFARSWALVQAAEAVPILLGVPLTGYMNASVPRVGYYACTLSSLCGAALLFLVGWGHQPPSPLLRASQLSHVSQQLPPPCACPPPPRPRLPKSQSLHVSLDVDRDMRNLQHKQYHQQQHQQQQQQQQQQQNLLNLPQQTPQHHQHQKQFLDTSERVCPHSVEHYCQSGSYHNPLRPSKSVPEGLSNHHEGTFRPRPRRYRDVTVIEQITTSV